MNQKRSFLRPICLALLMAMVLVGFPSAVVSQVPNSASRQSLEPHLTQWPSQATEEEPKPGGVIEFALPEISDEGDSATNPNSPRQSPNDSMVRKADYSQPIEPIPDPVTNPSRLGSLPDAPKQLGGFLSNLSNEENLSQFQSTLAKVDFPKVAGSLAIVLGVYFAFVWLTRQIQGSRPQGLPQEVVEVLGFAPFGPKQRLQLVRLGSKLLLLLHGTEGTSTIGEIADPNEVEYLVGLCQGRRVDRGRQQIRHLSADRSEPNARNNPARTPEVSIPAKELENVVRQIANSNQSNVNVRSVFEA